MERGLRRLLIVYHSKTGGTRQMAEAAAQGAREGGEVRVDFIAAGAAGAEAVLAADGYIFACPENLASMAGVMKDFFDRSYYPALGRIEGRPYASLICAGSDGQGAARQIARIVTGWRLKAVAEPLVVNLLAQTPEAILAPKLVPEPALARCRDLGATLAAGLAMGMF